MVPKLFHALIYSIISIFLISCGDNKPGSDTQSDTNQAKVPSSTEITS